MVLRAFLSKKERLEEKHCENVPRRYPSVPGPHLDVQERVQCPSSHWDHEHIVDHGPHIVDPAGVAEAACACLRRKLDKRARFLPDSTGAEGSELCGDRGEQ